MTDHWFKPKTHGYGATPTTWQGWAVTIAYALLMITLCLWIMITPGVLAITGIVLAWLLTVGCCTAAFYLFVKSKTDGDWKWRWGEKE
jgi:hypothetical protein